MPSVSVIIPAYNAGEFITEALDSVVRQTYRDIEILVVDDGSTDDTAAIVEGYGSAVRLFRGANQGAARARNIGIATASGDFVAFLDADDIWESEKVERQVQMTTKECRFVYTDTIAFGVESMAGSRMSSGRSLPSGSILPQLIEDNFVATSSVLLDRHLALRVGGFDPQFRICQDWILWLRAARLTEVATIAEPLVRYRIRPGSLGSSVLERIRDCRGVIQEGLAMVEMTESEKRKLRARAVSNCYRYGATLATADHRRAIALWSATASFWYHPTRDSFKQMVKSFIGPRVSGWLSRMRPEQRS